MLDLGRGVRWRRRKRQHRQAGGKDEYQAKRESRGTSLGTSPGTNPEIGHERFSSRFGAASWIRWPVPELFLSSHFCAASRTWSAVTARIRSGQLLMSSMLRPLVSAPPYQRASVAWLSWA